MFRRLIPLAVLVAIIVGCSKKRDDSGGGGESRGVDSDPSATFVLKLREAEQGDRSEYSHVEATTTDFAGVGKTEKTKQEKNFEFAEHIVDMPAAAKSPKKVTRTYRVAKKTDFKSKELKPLPFEGKTVTIEKKGNNYQCSMDGKPLNVVDSSEIDSDFRNPDKGSLKELLPNQAVKVGETWDVNPNAMKSMSGGNFGGVDLAKSKFKCHLARAFTLDGKQWGVIAFDFNLVLDEKGKGKGSTSGSVKLSGTLDAVIDGSARDRTMKGTVAGGVTVKDPKGEVKIALDGTINKTIKTAK